MTGTTMLVVAGERFLSTYELDGRELVIGRDRGCDVIIDHSALSRRHAAVAPGPPITVSDLGSTNGTRVAGVVRRGGAPCELTVGESFRIGPFSFLVVGRGGHDEHSVSMRDVLRIPDPTPTGVPALVKHVAMSPASVLILGETGVGKEVLAETLHQLSGRTGPLARINCAALSANLLESELFGHEKGAFTGAAAAKLGLLEGAQHGTVFLDEIGELPLTIQAKLLRAVERREVLRVGAIRPVQVDVRFVAATNRDLPAEVEAGRFRRDLFFRLDGVTLIIPPLRERRAMIGGLALGFLHAAAGDRIPRPRLSAELLAALEAYAWPGNVRELKAVIERALLLSGNRELGVRHLSFARQPAGDRPPSPVALAPPTDELDREPRGGTQHRERARVLAALEACAGNQTRAAKQLGIGRTTLLRRLRLYRIPRPRT